RRPPTPQLAARPPCRPPAPPAATAIRTGSGRPGPDYWQQRADYRIRATLNPDKQELTGRETIHYVNHSPDRLPYLWFHVEQNICEPGSVTNQLDQPPLVFLGSTFDFSCHGGGRARPPATAARSGLGPPPPRDRPPTPV